MFIQNGVKFKVTYAPIGFQPGANLDVSDFWPTPYRVTQLTAADQEQPVAMRSPLLRIDNFKRVKFRNGYPAVGTDCKIAA